MQDRLADRIPACLLSDDSPIDEAACEAFFHARRDVILGKEEDGPPLIRLPKDVSDRWQAFRIWRLKGRKGPPPWERKSPKMSTFEVRKPADVHPFGGEMSTQKPWEALGISRDAYYKRKQREKEPPDG